MRHLTSFRLIDAVARAGSIRKAAERMNLTPSALNRRVRAFEDELGVVIFERLPRGVRLNTAGEIVIQHARAQMADMDRVRSQIADLAGMRRGHVAIACSQALTTAFLPEQIAAYRAAFPAVSFDVEVRDRLAAEEALLDFSADVALVFEPTASPEFQTLMTVRQQLHAVMASDHPLAAAPVLRLRDCFRWPLALPGRMFGGRKMLEEAVARSSLEMRPALQSNSFAYLMEHVLAEPAITFQIPIGVPAGDAGTRLASRPIDERDVPAGLLLMGQRRGRTLPVAAARFCDQLAQAFAGRFDCV